MSGSHVVRFGVFELDLASGELRRHGLKIRLPDQCFQILKVLLRRPGELVTRDELRQVLWASETFVDFEVGLNSAVRKLREALDDSAEDPRYVETLPRRGYRFVAPILPAVVPVADPAPESQRPPPVDAPPPATPVPATLESFPPPSARLRHPLWLGAAFLLVVLTAIGVVVYRRGEPIRVLVVLPFENLTGDPSQDYFVDAVTDAVTGHLGEVRDLDVISRTTARQYKLTSKQMSEIGRDLSVDGVVEGSVARSPGGVHITVRLNHAATDRLVWGNTYDSDVGRMLPVQRQIASEIAAAAVRRTPSAAAAGSTALVDPGAYDAYLKGMTAQGKQDYQGFRRAVTYFEEAVRIQPAFAEGHAALALAQMQLLFGGPLSPHEVIPKAEAAARQALQLDEGQALAHKALGQILLLYHWRTEEGYKALDRAAALEGGGADVTLALSTSLRRRGRVQEAIAVAERGRKLDPLSLNAQLAVGNAYRGAGQYERAIDALRQAAAMSPGRPRVHLQLGVTFVAMGRYADAIRELETAVQSPPTHNSRIEAYLGYAYAAAGRGDEARAVLKELETHRREQYVSWFGSALIHDALGEKAPALAALRRAYLDHAVEFGLLDQYPRFKAIELEPEYVAVMRHVGR